MPTILSGAEEPRMTYGPYEGFKFEYAIDQRYGDRSRAFEGTPGMRHLVDYTYWTSATAQALALAFVQQGFRRDEVREVGFACLLVELDRMITDEVLRGDRLDIIARERYFTQAMAQRPDRHEIITSLEWDYDMMRRQYRLILTTRGIPRPEESDEALGLSNVPEDVIDWAKGAIRVAVGAAGRRLTFRRKEKTDGDDE